MEKLHKILIVDADQFLLDMYALKFSKSNFEVRTAHRDIEALQIVREGFDPEILLVDIRTLGGDGAGFLEVLREEKRAKKAVVIILTNQGLPDDPARVRKIDADGYIIKVTTVPSEVLAEVNKIYLHT